MRERWAARSVLDRGPATCSLTEFCFAKLLTPSPSSNARMFLPARMYLSLGVKSAEDTGGPPESSRLTRQWPVSAAHTRLQGRDGMREEAA